MARPNFRIFITALLSCSVFVGSLGGVARGQAEHEHSHSETEGALFSKRKDVPPGATDKEVKLGDKAAADIEKHPKIKILAPDKDEKSKALYEKLNHMARELGKNSARPKIEYKVKVIDDPEVNAFTLPNGNIYFYQGLIDLLGSDDEIAAVMAHEIGHNAEMHHLRGSAKAQKLSWIGVAAMLAALAGGQSGGDIALFSQYLLTGIMSGYSVDYEKEADSSAVETMHKSGYNPSALVTVMQRFEAEEKRRPKIEPGIFRTHPPSAERVDAVRQEVVGAGLPFNPRAVTGGATATVVEADDRVTVQIRDLALIEFAPVPSTLAAKERADKTAAALSQLLKDNLKLHEIQLQPVKDESGDTHRLWARGVEIARVLPADAEMESLTTLATAQKWRLNLRQIFWRETIHGAL